MDFSGSGVLLRRRSEVLFLRCGFSDRSLASQGNTKPDMEIVTRVMGPKIGYVTTPIILLQCAPIVLSQRDSLPKGGVFPAGIVFGPTDLQERLQENGVAFDVISKNAISAGVIQASL